MIAAGMPVQIRRCGTSVPVERLEIGDLIYDPLADNYLELVDILSRNTDPLRHGLSCIRAGRFRTGVPNQDIIVSRQQPICVTDRGMAPRTVHVRFDAAYRFGDALEVSATLFALFSERQGSCSVSGMILQVSDPSALSNTSSSVLLRSDP